MNVSAGVEASKVTLLGISKITTPPGIIVVGASGQIVIVLVSPPPASTSNGSVNAIDTFTGGTGVPVSINVVPPVYLCGLLT